MLLSTYVLFIPLLILLMGIDNSCMSKIGTIILCVFFLSVFFYSDVLNIAFKFFMSTTLAVRMAGLNLITVRIILELFFLFHIKYNKSITFYFEIANGHYHNTQLPTKTNHKPPRATKIHHDPPV